jgi:hypothetical protein
MQCEQALPRRRKTNAISQTDNLSRRAGGHAHAGG